jgi:hypothetical protein
MQRLSSLLIAALLAASAACGPTVIEPRQVIPERHAFRLHPANPHYFEYEGKPTVLVTSGEHYGALMNLDFDYVKYFDELQSKGLNHTRVFSATYREVSGNFGIVAIRSRRRLIASSPPGLAVIAPALATDWPSSTSRSGIQTISIGSRGCWRKPSPAASSSN